MSGESYTDIIKFFDKMKESSLYITPKKTTKIVKKSEKVKELVGEKICK